MALLVDDAAAVTAYSGSLDKLLTANGATYNYLPSSTLGAVGQFILLATGKGAGRWLLQTTYCNVLDFGADNTAATDSSGAINAAITYAKSLSGINGGTFRMYILFPPGWYLLYSTIDVTNASGIWLVADGGSYINTGFIGATSNPADGSGLGIIVDFTGSSFSGLRNISLTADLAWGNRASKIALLYALGITPGGTVTGGLNCILESCFIQMYDSASLNGGFGTIGLLNVRAEEFSVKDCVIKTNLPMLFSSTSSLSVDGATYTVTTGSSTVSVATTPNGSMGVTNCTGQMSLQTIQRRKPALILINTDSFNYFGYIGRSLASEGTEETAIRFVGQTDNPVIQATIESYSRIAKFGTQIVNPQLRIVAANQTNSAVEVFDCTGSEIISPVFSVSFRVPGEFNNGRVFLYHAPISGGDSPATGSIGNGAFYSAKWIDNTNFISANLLKTSSNSFFNSGQPFAKINGALVDKKTYDVPMGTTSSGHPDVGANLIRFSKADRTTKTSGNAGTYRATVNGTIIAGSYSSANIVSYDFRSTMVVTQKADGTLNTAATNTVLLNKSASNTALLDITNIVLILDLSTSVGQVFCIVVNNATGAGIGEPIVFNGVVEVTSDFAVNQSIIFN